VAENDGPLPDRVDAVLRDWRQGDCVLGEQWFLFRADPDAPLTPEAEEAAEDGADAAEAEVPGLMVVTQTCDIVRRSRDRPFIQVCPLVRVEESELLQIERARFPQYALVPGVAEQHLVADLDRAMTVEKAVVSSWERSPGCTDDRQRRNLRLAIARKRSRAAFPDDFADLAKKLQARLKKKHGRTASPEGHALRALREIRVRAVPSWDAPEVDVIFFWFLRDDNDDNGSDWIEHLEKWLGLVPAAGRFKAVEGVVASLDDLTARDYVESDPLDLDHLSTSTNE
jgi:hypothetical protein